MNTAGIDYGLGQSNIDHETGIRFGVIQINNLSEYIWDDLTPEYGDPSCPDCGAQNITPVTELTNDIDNTVGDYYCEHCQKGFDSDACFGDEPLSWELNAPEYKTISAFDNTCFFIEKSPYYTFCKYCSPCAPGAGDLDAPDIDGIKAYCFGHDMFDANKAPYPVYRISDNTEVLP